MKGSKARILAPGDRTGSLGEPGTEGTARWERGRSEGDDAPPILQRVFGGFEQTDEDPVVGVSWNDASAFCDWLSEKEVKKYVLPTEAQW